MILAKASQDCQLPFPKAIIFDFDGVVADSLSAHLDAWNSASLQIFRKPISDFDKISGLSTLAISSLLAHAYGQPGLAGELRRLKEVYLSSSLDKIMIFHGFREFLDKIRQIGVPVAIGSNSSTSFISKVLNAHSISIEVIIGIDQVVKPKPHPEIFLTCAKKLHVALEFYQRVLVFEDSTHGLAAARKAGMIPCGVCSVHPPEVLINAGAQYVTDQFRGITFVTD